MSLRRKAEERFGPLTDSQWSYFVDQVWRKEPTEPEDVEDFMASLEQFCEFARRGSPQQKARPRRPRPKTYRVSTLRGARREVMANLIAQARAFGVSWADMPKVLHEWQAERMCHLRKLPSAHSLKSCYSRWRRTDPCAVQSAERLAKFIVERMTAPPERA